MEENRLKPMKEGYDAALFNSLYEKTRSLTRKLARGINHERFGVTPEDVVSWFDVKFIYVFNKYYDNPPEVLLGFIINSLQTYKSRIIKDAYTQKNSQTIIPMDNVSYLDIGDTHTDDPDNYYNKLMSFMKKHLSDNAYLILELQFNPSPYIIKRLNESGCDNIHKIPDEIILDYLDLGFGEKANKYLCRLKKEIKEAILLAKFHFKN